MSSKGKTASDVGDYLIPPLSRNDLIVHVAGAVLNGLLLTAAVTWLAAHAHTLAHAGYLLILAVLGATYVADFVTGLLHWAFDTWFAETSAMERMVLLVREHHTHPERIFSYKFRQDAGLLSWFAALAAAPMLAISVFDVLGPQAGCAFAVASIVTSLEIVFMLQFHKCGHTTQPGPLVRCLQAIHVLLPARHHLQHHAGAHDRNYCLVNGLFDRTAGALGFWRGLEALVSFLTGAVPRENDRLWMRRHGATRSDR